MRRLLEVAEDLELRGGLDLLGGFHRSGDPHPVDLQQLVALLDVPVEWRRWLDLVHLEDAVARVGVLEQGEAARLARLLVAVEQHRLGG